MILGRAMVPSSEDEERLAAAVAGIPLVAEAVATTPDEVRTKILNAVEDSYRQTARDFGCDEDRIGSWVSTLMLRLQAELERRLLVKQKLLEALQEELLKAPKTLQEELLEAPKPLPEELLEAPKALQEELLEAPSSIVHERKEQRVMAKRHRGRRRSRQPGLKVRGSVSS